MNDFPPLPAGPLPHLALDYARLREEGVRLLEQFASAQWSDFNTHDPGITLLEQLCYAMTDLAYRASYDVPDLLAAGGLAPYQSLYGALAILTSHPVTLLDLRKAVIDVDGVKNAWIEERLEAEPPLQFHAAKGELGFHPDPPYTTPVLLKGRLRALIEICEPELLDLLGLNAAQVQAEVARRLHACRPLCADFDKVLVLTSKPVRVCAVVEIGPEADLESVVLDIYQALLASLSDSIAFKTLGEMLATGKRSDEIFDGPVLEHGFLASESLEQLRRREAIHTSDLIREIMGVSGVQAVRKISVAVEEVSDAWSVPLDPLWAPVLDLHASSITLVKRGVEVVLDTQRIRRTLTERRGKEALRRHLSPGERDFIPPVGRDRNLARYSSIQQELPALYGVGPAGLSDSATPRRQAQALQLKAYLQFFDQLLASCFDQLAQAGSRFSFFGEDTRFDNHLLARFAEPFADDSRAFLRCYPRISSARGTGRDALLPASAGEVSGLQERIERMLGLAQEERLFLVEHLLLAPLGEDDVPPGTLDYRQVPFLSGCPPGEPFSLQLSFVVPRWRDRMREDALFQGLLEQTVRAETPAHLIPYIRWVDEEVEWLSFERAYREWLDAYSDYRADKLGLLSLGDPRYFRVRDARDRIIDLLRLGETYPLRDLPVHGERLTAAYNQSVDIRIDYSQRGVLYELRGEGCQSLAPVEGNGGTISLRTPPMTKEAVFNILARKRTTGREVYLRQQATVRVGLDVMLPARILDAPLLDPGIEPPGRDADARIVAWGTRVRVQVDRSQEGVDYHVVQCVDGQELRLSPDVRGNRKELILLVDAASEDVDLRIRATKVFGPSESSPTEPVLLEAVLPLKVRARPDLPVSVEPSSIVDFGEDASIRIDNTQPGARYRLYLRPVPDRDFVFDGGAAGLLAVDVEDAPRVYVRRPPQLESWEDLEGFKPVGEPMQGNGGTLRLPVSALAQDSVVLVQARKEHQARVNIPSAVQLQQAALLLARPDPNPALRLAVVMNGSHTTGTLEVSGGQPGVFYAVRSEPSGAALGLPAYFHKRDERDAALNKGLGQLRPEVDFVITRGTVRPAATPAERASTPPLTPLLATGPLDEGTTLHLRAIKAQTRVAADLRRTARIDAVLGIQPVQGRVPRGTPAKILVRGSAADERYQLTQEGQPIGAAMDGTGGDLTFITGPLLRDTQFEMWVTRPGETGFPVERRVQVRVGVK